MADVAKFERRLHSCQVILWLKQNYDPVAPHDEEAAIPKESVYARYLDHLCRRHTTSAAVPRQHSNDNEGHDPPPPQFSKAVVGKMVKRAFPSVRSRRLAMKGTTKQFYIGIRSLFTPTSSSSSSPLPCSSPPASSLSPGCGSTSPPVADSTPPSPWEHSTESEGKVGDRTTRNWIQFKHLPSTRPAAAAEGAGALVAGWCWAAAVISPHNLYT